ncbi:hypothetical protein F2Q68_00025213 [Brassica cretica]|uniref:Uncharacterized protein n=1 Tax=Brassica cretica TaxID=69181 RepID=A0A8S9IFL9_BRACR|nr:hypothetical protein F2Q68_00025213 [Brassica cretica]
MAPKSKEKPKTSQPPPAIEDLFTTLDRHINRSEYEQAVKVADQVLSIAPADEDAIRCKVVALVKDDKIDDALFVIHSFHKLPIDLGFQKVLGQHQESISSYVDIIKRNIVDESSLAVAVINLIALKGSKDVSDGLRKLDRLKEQDSQIFKLSQALDAKLSQKHKEAIYANRVLMLLHANKIDQVLVT